MARDPPLMTLDGPAGAGKGTVGLTLARELGWHYLDSGALYRSLALSAERAGLGPERAAEVIALARQFRFDLRVAAEGVRIYLNTEEVTEATARANRRVAQRAAARVPRESRPVGKPRR